MELFSTLSTYLERDEDVVCIEAFAWTVMRRAMNVYDRSPSGRVHVEDVSLDDAHVQRALDRAQEQHCRADREVFERVLVDEFIAEVQRLHGDRAVLMLSQLVEPTDVVGRFVVRELKRRNAARDNGEDVRRTQSGTANRRQVREALGYVLGEWYGVLREVRALAETWWPEHTNAPTM
jgi:hypothetical protein